ncbi:baeRF2 domain-containing protein [Glaciibacter sp. 2TAF33]|uniref:baeRF2 domain-containing protein n=1 Tax=Glaciibacter sp. 2TAF33 TaxID=3233015 RepID=UPI003F8FABA4
MADFGNDALSDLYRRRDDVSTAYVDVSQDASDARRTSPTRLRAVRDTLSQAGAPTADTDAIAEILEQPPGVASPVSRFIVVRSGEVEVSEVLPGQPMGERILNYGPLPAMIPLLKHRPRDLRYVVAEVGRDGGEIRLYRLSRVQPLWRRDMTGDTQFITKVHAGGWSNKGFQRDAEETWKRNEGELAEVIDRLVRENRVELLVVAGDVRARQLLVDQLAPASRAVLAVVHTNTRPEDASNSALEAEVKKQLIAILAREEDDALNQLVADSNREGGRAEVGVGAVVHALQQGQVEALILCATGLAEKTLLALTAEPWVATAPEDALGAGSLGRVAAADALVRAAVLCGARVFVVDAEQLPERVSVGALLRWQTGPDLLGPAATRPATVISG